ncbi:MAG: hypothetical protein N2376_10570 [Clostridia bacterium]|nr:hypothetical protein [Clostridia bacterium]
MLQTILSKSADYAIAYLIQFIIGIVLSYPAYKLAAKHREALTKRPLVWAALFAFIGILIPVGPLGVLPLVIGLSIALRDTRIAIPMLAANAVFNMSIPLTETGFTFGASYVRILSAFVIGLVSYFAISILCKDSVLLIRKNKLELYEQGYNKNLLELFPLFINEIGIFLILAVILNAVRSNLFSDAMMVFLNTSGGDTVKNALLERNANNSVFFISATSIFNNLIDLSIPAALLSFFKARTTVLFYILSGIATIVLVAAIFF